MTMTTKAPKCAAAIILGVALAGCASMPWSKPKATMSCFWMTQDGAQWIQRDDVESKAMCFALDSCSGGQGLSGGGCYKWAPSASQPGEKW